MRLKRVKIFGFKTFADKVEFDIDGDLVAVVGPNGCGKSNLVDAILWGLGEGNARQLRAQTGVDVIFNGSANRKPVGFAEVSLYFDNEDGALPIPTPEVVVTRRLTKSGDSDYSINRQNCRLRDVLELLADSGLGRAGYSIVGQSEIDSALAASPEDRRAWIDEAAGVQRYRARKIESLRRLASANDHLSRVKDIWREIESQREPLREEAEVAIRYKAALGALREVESGLLIVEVARAVREALELETRIEGAAKLMAEESHRADRLEDEIARIGQQISTLEIEMDSLRASQQSAITQIERADAAIRLGEQRLASFAELEANFGDEAKNAEFRLEEMRRDIESMEADATAESEAFDRISTESSGAGDEAKALQAQLTDIDGKLETARKVHSENLRLAAESAQRALRLKEVKRELDSAKSALPQVQEAEAQARKEWEKAHKVHGEFETKLSARNDQIEEARKQAEMVAKSLRDLLAEQASLEGRKRGIENTIETHEGLAMGARAVIEAVENGSLKGDFLPVGEAIEVDKKYAVAIETALGNSSSDLITPTEFDAKRAIEFLKENRAGRATFQPIPLMRPHSVPPEIRKLLDRPNVVGLASELVECEDSHRPVIDALLGRILVVKDVDTALPLAKTTGWNRLVTLEGEVVHHSGAVTGGRAAKTTYGLVQRKADVVEIEERLAGLNSEIAQIDSTRTISDEEFAAIESEIATLRHQIKAASAEEQEARKWAASVADELNSTTRAIAKLEAESHTLVQINSKETTEVDIASLESERDAILKSFAAKSADAEQAETRIREAEQRKRLAAERLESAKRRLAHAIENESARERKLGALTPERARVSGEIDEAQKLSALATEKKVEAESKLAKVNETKREALEKTFGLNEEVKSIRASAKATGEAAHQAEIARARAESKRANSLQRLIEEYGLSEEDALAQEASIELPADAAQVTGRLRREIKAMGDVNVGAIEAYERLTERANELEIQTADIEGGIEEVVASIRELDKLTRERFLTTFASVQENFAELFTRLFPGGEGSLDLTNPENTLESGIDIDVQLPGKKKQRLELLSGGERSLCASAFLFALLRAKPSPLVVLDEVDAPLDGRNVEKFIELLRDFSKEIQFIVITHNPTTIAAAPVWLGITMSEPGVSTLAPVRLREPANSAMLV